MDKRNLRVLFMIACVGLAFAGTVSLLSAIFAGTGSLVSGIFGIVLAVVFYLLWKDAKKRS